MYIMINNIYLFISNLNWSRYRCWASVNGTIVSLPKTASSKMRFCWQKKFNCSQEKRCVNWGNSLKQSLLRWFASTPPKLMKDDSSPSPVVVVVSEEALSSTRAFLVDASLLVSVKFAYTRFDVTVAGVEWTAFNDDVDVSIVAASETRVWGDVFIIFCASM